MIDTNVLWLAFSSGTTERALISRGLLDDAEERQGTLLVATITLVELFKVPEPPNITLERLAVVNQALESPALTWVDLDRPTGLRARELALEHGIHNPYDAAVLACAVMSSAQALLTWDLDDFDDGRTYSGVRVAPPSWRSESQLRLPEEPV